MDYPRSGKRGFRRWLPSWRQIFGTFLAIGALGVGIIVAAYFTTDIPAANDFVTEETTNIYYADGETLMGSFAAQNREIIDTTKLPDHVAHRSEERRVGKECRARWGAGRSKKMGRRVDGRVA